MSSKEQRRAWVLSRVDAAEMGAAEAARLLGLTQRGIRQSLARLERDGPAGLVFGNRGRPSPRRLSDETRMRVMDLEERTHTDSPRHDWLSDRVLCLTLNGFIGDATRRVTAATFRD